MTDSLDADDARAEKFRQIVSADMTTSAKIRALGEMGLERTATELRDSKLQNNSIMCQNIKEMRYRKKIGTREIFLHLRESRNIQSAEGVGREITARKVVWEMIDWLVQEWAYPVGDLIDETILLYGPEQFDYYFEDGVLMAATAQAQISAGVANDNLFYRSDFREMIPMDHPVWATHQTSVTDGLLMPKIYNYNYIAKFYN